MSRPIPNAPRKLVRLDEAADQLSLSVKTIRRRIADGTITGYRVGGHSLRVDPDEFHRLVRPIGGAA